MASKGRHDAPAPRYHVGARASGYKIGGKSMGKRELFIALAFTVVAVVAYQMTAPDPSPGERRFSFSRIWNEARREIRGNSAQATVTSTGQLAASSELVDLRFESVRVGEMRLKLIGEARADIRYELAVQSNGPDEATA